MKKKTSVIICAYTMERWDALSDAVTSVAEQTLPPDEVLVVIDYNDQLLALADASFQGVRVIENRMTKGLSGARNTGIREASGDIFVFLDDDAYADPEWLERLLSVFDEPNVAGCGGWIVPDWEATKPQWFPDTFLWVMGCSYDGLPEHGAAIRNPIGANMAIRRRVVETVGDFSAGLGRIGTVPLGCEETELCIRYGRQVPEDRFVLARDAVVHHRVPALRVTWSYFLRRCWSEGVSKAAVASLVGHGDGLAAERRHAAVAIPREMMSSFRELWRTPSMLGKRLVAVVGGSLVAVSGLIRGKAALRKHPIASKGASQSDAQSDTTQWKPVEIIQVDIGALPNFIDIPETANERAWVEFTREGQVVGREILVSDRHRIMNDALEFVATQFAHRTPSFIELPDDQLPSISVVIPTICKDPESLKKFAESLDLLDYPNFEVILVDNRVTPTYDMPDVSELEHVRVVAERIPGISAARNRGILEAQFEIVAFTDDDVEVDSRWLRAIGGRLATQPEISALGGLVLPAVLSTQPQLWFEEYFGGFSHSFDFRVSHLGDYPDGEIFPYTPGRYAAGCNMAFRRDALIDMGGFLVSLGTGTPAFGGEDLEAVITLASRGLIIAFEPAALIRHIHRETSEQFLKQAFGYGAGLTAMYFSLIRREPSHLVKMVLSAPRGFKSLMTSREERSMGMQKSYPITTASVERRGMLYGPIAYLKSRRKFRDMKQLLELQLGELSRF